MSDHSVQAAINAAIALWEATYRDDPREIVISVDVARRMAEILSDDQRRQLSRAADEGIAADGWHIHGIPMQIDRRLRPGAVVAR